MAISLIANSGIQLHTIPVSIDFKDSDHILYFHEWTDMGSVVEEQLELVSYLRKNKIFYKRSELEKNNYANPITGELLLEEHEIIARTELTTIGRGTVRDNQELFEMDAETAKNFILSMMNQWLPAPFYEQVDGRKGPYNWCRIKLIPKQKGDLSKEQRIDATLLIAFDTHSEYRAITLYDECPVFEVTSEKEKILSLPGQPSLLLDFCIGGDKWVGKGLMRLVYNTDNIDNVPGNPRNRVYKYAYLASYIWLLDYLKKNFDIPTIRLKRDQGEPGVYVDMVIDIGNSRTAAILFEDYEEDFSNVKPLGLQNWTHPVTDSGELNRTEESFDMRVAFQCVEFGNYIQRSNQFVWPSMVRLGSEAQELTFQTGRLSDGDEKYSTYSSPKRYLWDDTARKKNEEWCQVRIDENGKRKTPGPSQVVNYFNDDGSINKNALGYGGHYSRRTLMTFAMLEILTQTHVQINSYVYREAKGRLNQGRYIRRIILTCPTGMSKKEQRSLHQCLDDALFVFHNSFSTDGKPSQTHPVEIIPNLSDGNNPQWMYDEATCSQFVYLYDLLTETYENCSGDLFQAYGKLRNGKQSLIVGSLDIGAGTSDIMIARYDTPEVMNTARIAPIPLYWDSFDTAGDDMLRDLISNVLIQGSDGQLEQLLKADDHWTEDEVRGMLFAFFDRNQGDQTFSEKMLRRDFSLQVLVPLMYEFLRLHSMGEGERDIHFDDIFIDQKPSDEVLERFSEVFKIDLKTIVWHFNRKVLDKYIVASPLGKIVEKIASIMCAYDCDVVLLSGRPTSLKPIEETFLSAAPRFVGKLVMLNNYEVGGAWFPFINKEHRKINNSKSIVPVGAIIGYLSSAGGLKGFSVDLSHLAKGLAPTTDYFVLNNATGKSNESFLKKNEQKGELRIDSLPVYIGTRQFDMSLYPIRPFYVLTIDTENIRKRILRLPNADKLTDKDIDDSILDECQKISKDFPLMISFHRDMKVDKETLEITKVKSSATNEELSADDFKLSIQSLNDPDCYWLDSGVYAINTGIGRSK